LSDLCLVLETVERADQRKLRCPGTSGISPEVDFQQQKESMLRDMEFRNSGVFWPFLTINVPLLERCTIVNTLHTRLESQQISRQPAVVFRTSDSGDHSRSIRRQTDSQ
jgi:hypothetical protein